MARRAEPPGNILEAITAEIERQIQCRGFAVKWEVYEQIKEDTGLLRSHFFKAWKIWVQSGRAGYQQQRPTAEQRECMGNRRRWVVTPLNRPYKE